MKRILVPTDFSTCAGNALDFAVQSAKLLGAEITLLHSWEIPGAIVPNYVDMNPAVFNDLEKEVEEKLALLRKVIGETEGVIVHSIASPKPLITAISETVLEKKIDLVVMGTLGAGGMKAKLLGSNTATLLANTSIPVMVIPFFYEWKKPVKLLLATNHFEQAPTILDYLFELADLYMAQVQVAVFSDEDDDDAIATMEHARKIHPYEKMLQTKYKEDTLKAVHLSGAEFEDTLQDYMKHEDIDILVMITYRQKRSFLKRIFEPSLTKKMSYHTNSPLLVIPAL